MIRGFLLLDTLRSECYLYLGASSFFTPYVDFAVDTFGANDTVDYSKAKASTGLQWILL